MGGNPLIRRPRRIPVSILIRPEPRKETINRLLGGGNNNASSQPVVPSPTVPNPVGNPPVTGIALPKPVEPAANSSIPVAWPTGDPTVVVSPYDRTKKIKILEQEHEQALSFRNRPAGYQFSERGQEVPRALMQRRNDAGRALTCSVFRGVDVSARKTMKDASKKQPSFSSVAIAGPGLLGGSPGAGGEGGMPHVHVRLWAGGRNRWNTLFPSVRRMPFPPGWRK